jgi:2-dehydro-3-deoxyglucarate aldolase/4-hydroxy-2-oxoheptanedioate aldolase
MSPAERIREMYRKGELIRGIHVQIGNPMVTELLAKIGFDMIWIDMEHTGMTVQNVLPNLIAIAASHKTASIVRIPWNDPVMAKPVLDMGADGLVFPMIRNAKEGEAAIAACLYPPGGVRGFGPIRAVDYGLVNADEYVKNTSKTDIFKIIQIEHIDAVNNIENILALPCLDAVVIGAMDLSASIGVLPDGLHPKVKEAVRHVKEKANAAKIPFGFSGGYNPSSNSGLGFWLEELGVDFVFAASDWSLVFDGACRLYKALGEK